MSYDDRYIAELSSGRNFKGSATYFSTYIREGRRPSIEGCRWRWVYLYVQCLHCNAVLFYCRWGCLPSVRRRASFLFLAYPSDAVVDILLWSSEFCSLALRAHRNLAMSNTATTSQFYCWWRLLLRLFQSIGAFSWWDWAWGFQLRSGAFPCCRQKVCLSRSRSPRFTQASTNDT